MNSQGKTGATPSFLFSEIRELYRLFRATGREQIIGRCPPVCWIITVYEPDPEEWIGAVERRRK
jgi:hypothetical protein